MKDNQGLWVILRVLKKWGPIAGIVAVIAICAVIIGLALNGSLPFDTLNRYQYVVSFLAALLGAFTAFIVFTRTVASSALNKSETQISNRYFFPDPSSFINRLDDMRKLLNAVAANNVVCVYGQKGVGKSEFLKFSSDLFRAPKKFSKRFGESVILKVSKRKVVYVDLFDSSSIDDVINQISGATTGASAASASDLLANIKRILGQSRLVIILDNLNNLASVQSVVNLVRHYGEVRPEDSIILGSIKCITDPRIQIAPVELLPFNSTHCGEYFKSRELQLAEEEIQAVMNKTGGLPLFIGLIAHYYDLGRENHGDFSEYFVEEIYLKLEPEQRDLLLFICVCNLSVTTLSPRDLNVSDIQYLDSKLKALHRYSSIIWTASEDGGRIKAHDLIRDIVLRHERHRISATAGRVLQYFAITNPMAATLPTLLAATKETDSGSIIDQLNAHIERKEYPVIINLWENLTEKAQPESLFSQSEEIREILLLGYLRSLLGIGNYLQARELTQSAIFRKIISSRPGKLSSRLDYDIQFALSDLDHLLNNYELARATIEFIISECERLQWDRELAQARWQWAHLTGHIGDDLNAALRQYKLCEAFARETADPILEARAFNGAASIQFTMNRGVGLSEDGFSKHLITLQDIPGNGPALSSILRNLSRYYRINDRLADAARAIEQSADIARKTGLRTLINCDFGRGENARFAGQYQQALKYYKLVIDATLENGDDNLCTSAMLGATICDMCYTDDAIYTEHHNNISDVCTHVDQIAVKYNMLITAARSHLLRYIRGRVSGAILESRELLENELIELGLNSDLQYADGEIDALRTMEIHVH